MSRRSINQLREAKPFPPLASSHVSERFYVALARCDAGIRGVGGADESAAAARALRKGCGPMRMRLCNFRMSELELDDRPEITRFFSNLKAALPELEALVEECNSDWVYEDGVYRFYHQSFKVYLLQESALRIVEKLRALAPDREFNEWFAQILTDGTGKTFAMEDNENWPHITRPILEAFFHSKYFLEMAVKYGRSLEHPPRLMPSGWASLLYLYNLR